MTGPSHTVEIAGGWRLWRSFALRGAGFPASTVLRLAAPDACAAIDRMLADADRDPGARREAEALYDDARRAVAVTIRELAASPRLREAMLWQNRGAVGQGVDVLLRQPPGATNSKIRQHERLVAAYLQRYCTKNETIGFFGPVGWGTFAEELPGVEVRAGDAGVSQRETYFEYWCVDALATCLAQDPDLLPRLIPRRAPTTYLDGTVLHHPIDQRTELPPLYAAILACCDGERSAQQIADEIVARGDVADLEEVLERVAGLADQGLLTLALEIPTSDTHPERTLRRLLAGADKQLAQLDEIEARRRDISAAAGNPAALEPALAALDATFEQITGARAQRNAGKVHGGRTLVYEDCRRDLELRVGSTFLERVGEPLSLLLDSERWFTHELAARYRGELEAIYARLAGEDGAVVDYLRFWESCASLFPEAGTSVLVEAVRAEMQRRWEAILAFDPADRRVQRTVAQLRPLVTDAFAAPGPGVLGARHHTPDVLVAAAGPDAFARGDWFAVLGEVATGINLLAGSLFAERHDHPADLMTWMEQDRVELGVSPVIGKHVYARASAVSLVPRDIDVELGATRSWRDRSQVLGVGSLVVARQDGDLVVRDRAGKHCFELVTFLGSYLLAAYEQGGGNPLLPAYPHRPRIMIDGLAVCREQWRLAPESLAPLVAARGFDQLVAARRWARDLGLPRWVFIGLPEERKPVFIDFASLISVDILGRLAAKASRFTVTEMLPSLEQLWLPDARGELYTSELRIAAVDSKPWRSPRSVYLRGQS